jgi:hypothetical protein
MSVVECDVPRHSALGKDLIERADFQNLGERDTGTSGTRATFKALPAPSPLEAMTCWPSVRASSSRSSMHASPQLPNLVR